MPNNNKKYHAWSIDDVLNHLEVRPNQGLSEQSVRDRHEKFGKNEIAETRRRRLSLILLDQFKSIVVIILVAAGILAFAFARWPEGIAIFAVVIVNTLIGFISEWRSRRSVEALKQMGKPQTRIRREQGEQQVVLEALVPGDIVILEAGDIVPADLRVFEANGLRVDEAALTGESTPMDKQTQPLETDIPLAERSNLLFKGTTVVEGSAEGVVIATGMQTELGKIARMTQTAEEQVSPLEQRINRLGRRLAWIALAIAVILAVVGLLLGRPALTMIETAIALGVAAVPEGLLFVTTIALARGMWLMVRQQVLTKRLSAVETLGSAGIIMVDKTGTLTENRMHVREVVSTADRFQLPAESSADGTDADSPPPLCRRILQIGVLCNNAVLTGDDPQGDPTELALLKAGQQLGINKEQLLEETPEVREEPFDQQKMLMGTFHRLKDEILVAVKGAPQAVLDVCSHITDDDHTDRQIELTEQEKQRWLDEAGSLAAQGLRVLAFAEKKVSSQETEPYDSLCFSGLVGMLDPPRSGIEGALTDCRNAGIRVIMVTGDQPETALAIGREIGLTRSDSLEMINGADLGNLDDLTGDDRERILQTDIFARVSPEQKFKLLKLFQDRGSVVAMTGDGINDAPALKKADIGIAMGRRGTDAAREVADMILKDDAFTSIVDAVKQGRIIFSNIRKSAMFMLCTNGAEVLAVAIASFAGIPLPLLPLQILYLNVLTDVFPALALGVGKGNEQVMQHSPRRPGEPVLTRKHWLMLLAWSVFIAALVLASLSWALYGLHLDKHAAVTVSFLTLAFAKLWFVLNLREPGTSLIRNEIVRNSWVWIAVGFCIFLLILSIYLPLLSDVLQTRPLSPTAWLSVTGFSLLPMFIGQLVLLLRRHGAAPGPSKNRKVTV